MPLNVTTIAGNTLRECGLPTQAAYINTQAGDLINRAAQEIAQLPLALPTRSYSVTLASQVPIVPTSVTRSGTTATVNTPTPHGFTTGDLTASAGMTPAGFNGQYRITVTSPTAYTYTMAADPGGNASSVGTVTHVAHGLPSDFRSYVANTAYINGNLNPVHWPADPSDWAILKAGNTNPGAVLIVRQIGGYLYIHEPDVGEVLTFEYLSNALFTDSTGFTGKQRFTADTDVWLLDDDLLAMNFKWRVKKERGLDDWQVDAAEWRTYARNYMAESRGARAISMGLTYEKKDAVAPYFNTWVS